MDSKRIPVKVTELTRDEKESVLRALGYYQVHLYDEMKNNTESSFATESQNITMAIKKIHQTIESQGDTNST